MFFLFFLFLSSLQHHNPFSFRKECWTRNNYLSVKNSLKLIVGGDWKIVIYDIIWRSLSIILLDIKTHKESLLFQSLPERDIKVKLSRLDLLLIGSTFSLALIKEKKINYFTGMTSSWLEDKKAKIDNLEETKKREKQ